MIVLRLNSDIFSTNAPASSSVPHGIVFFPPFLSEVSAFPKRKECDDRRCATDMRARSIVTSTQPEPCPWQSLSRSLVPPIVLSTIAPTIRHSSALFLITELDALGVRRGVRQLGRLILGRLVVRYRACGGLGIGLG